MIRGKQLIYRDYFADLGDGPVPIESVNRAMMVTLTFLQLAPQMRWP
jgi:hypothetical protein